jgi:hypothetical protein
MTWPHSRRLGVRLSGATADETNFIDETRTASFITEEHEIIG